MSGKDNSKLTVTIDMVFGSSSQEEFFEDMLSQVLYAFKQNMERKHKNNVFTFYGINAKSGQEEESG